MPEMDPGCDSEDSQIPRVTRWTFGRRLIESLPFGETVYRRAWKVVSAFQHGPLVVVVGFHFVIVARLNRCSCLVRSVDRERLVGVRMTTSPIDF